MSSLDASARYRLVFDEEFLLLRGFSLYMLGDEGAALKDFNAALDYSVTRKSSLNKDEVIYIKNYVFDVFSFSESNPYEFGGKYVEGNISSNLIDLFPLSDWLVGFSKIE
ncbi:hypothetical protein [Bacterioplanes sanyensis]|uniref:hypothetical protein n=1 Tax=Bacterioplanes sanyensis TaxID=1249553 RepID=UPI0012FE26EA|nr:hypothetical protein [Bacterioplanes sanyensis]